MIVLGWFLYPRELLLGYISEGLTELKDSETYYRQYLQKNPHSKFATLRLASVYDRMAEPERATALLQKLFDHRRQDWRVAVAFLDHLENIHADEALYRTRLEVVRRFKGDPRFPRGRLEQLLYEALQYVRWQQRNDEMYTIAGELIAVSRRPADYEGFVRGLDLGLQNNERVVVSLQQRVAEHPEDDETRQELVSTLMLLGRLDEALTVVAEGLQLAPDHVGLLKQRIALHDRQEKKLQVISDLEGLLGLNLLPAKDVHDYSVMLAGSYLAAGREADGIGLYHQLLERSKDDPDRRGEVIAALAQFYLYERHAVDRLPLYRDYLQVKPESRIAQDVGNLLLDGGLNEDAFRWLCKNIPRP